MQFWSVFSIFLLAFNSSSAFTVLVRSGNTRCKEIYPSHSIALSFNGDETEQNSTKIPLFETFNIPGSEEEESGFLLNSGGRVTSISWCPGKEFRSFFFFSFLFFFFLLMPSTVDCDCFIDLIQLDQPQDGELEYLIVGNANTVAEEHLLDSFYEGTNCIQLWSINTRYSIPLNVFSLLFIQLFLFLQMFLSLLFFFLFDLNKVKNLAAWKCAFFMKEIMQYN